MLRRPPRSLPDLQVSFAFFASKPRKVKGYSERARKPELCRTELIHDVGRSIIDVCEPTEAVGPRYILRIIVTAVLSAFTVAIASAVQAGDTVDQILAPSASFNAN